MESFDYSDEFLNVLTDVFKAFGSVIRLKIVLALRQTDSEGQKGLSVMELQDTVGTSQANVSKHLKVLENQGLLIVQSEGSHRIYSIGNDRVHQICDYVCDFISDRNVSHGSD